MKTILKTPFSFFTLAIALIPLWAYLAIWHLLKPQGFWQKLVMGYIGWAFFGIGQIIFLIFWGIIMVGTWKGNKNDSAKFESMRCFRKKDAIQKNP